jgi:hypothetical protein
VNKDNTDNRLKSVKEDSKEKEGEKDEWI